MFALLDPDPQAALADVEHREHAQNQEHAARVDYHFPWRAGYLEDGCLDLGVVVQLQINRRAVEEGVRQRIGGQLQEARVGFVGGGRRQTFLLARSLPQVPQAAVEDLHEDVGGLFLLRRRNFFQEVGDGNEAAFLAVAGENAQALF